MAKWIVLLGCIALGLLTFVDGVLFIWTELEERKVCKEEGDDFFLCWGAGVLRTLLGNEGKEGSSDDGDDMFLYPIPQLENILK